MCGEERVCEGVGRCVLVAGRRSGAAEELCARPVSNQEVCGAARGPLHCLRESFLERGVRSLAFFKTKEHKKEENERLCGHEQGQSHNHRE